MREISAKDQIPQTREGLLLYIKGFKRHLKLQQNHLEEAEKRLEIIEVELGIRTPQPQYFN